MNGYAFLAIAILCETFSTSMLKASAGFSKIIPSMAFIIGINISFYTLSQALNYIPLMIAYAIWAGMGTALTALIAVVVWQESINIYTGMGILLIIMGVVLLNLKGWSLTISTCFGLFRIEIFGNFFNGVDGTYSSIIDGEEWEVNDII